MSNIILKISNFGPFFGPFSAVNLKKATHPLVVSFWVVIRKALGVGSAQRGNQYICPQRTSTLRSQNSTGNRQILSRPSLPITQQLATPERRMRWEVRLVSENYIITNKQLQACLPSTPSLRHHVRKQNKWCN